MKKYLPISCFFLLLFSLPFSLIAQPFSDKEIAGYKKQSLAVSIIRDNWGIPHIYGKTDADAVFGLMYAQCEDDFNRVELNYIEKLGRLAEIQGKELVYDDLLNRLIIDQQAAQEDFRKSPEWLKTLCIAFADGINFYLYTHPEKKPALLTRFEPWWPMMWTDGSIGAISTAEITMNELKEFYGGKPDLSKIDPPKEDQPLGSNGFAIAPSKSASGNAMLYINPHVSFYFRPEVQMVSEQGLNAYGAVTWGQFFIYQGFNSFCGWMHTSSYVDAADSYIEKIQPAGNGFTYLYDGRQLPLQKKEIIIRYKNNGSMETATIDGLYTGHGPLMARRNGQVLSLRADNRLLNGLIQCWQRTKARSFADFEKTLALQGNISNNTVYADSAGNIAYWHGNRIPKRNPAINWSKPVDGTTHQTEWEGLHPVNETVHLVNPPNGWLQNCNSTPFSVAGTNSPVQSKYPAYMAPDGENFRGVNAVRTLSEENKYTLDKLIKAGYDRRLAAFEVLVPALLKAYEGLVPTDSLYTLLNAPVAYFKAWDFKSGEGSIATTLAVEWGQKLLPLIFGITSIVDDELDLVEKTKAFALKADASALLLPLAEVRRELEQKFGIWQLPWGEINRYQRISPAINQKFDDQQQSVPVGFAASTWGQLPSFYSFAFPGNKKRYGIYGNSFICAVEFGPRVHAKSLLAGGESGDANSVHFRDQMKMYATGQFKEVLFYREDLDKHTERKYRPGE